VQASGHLLELGTTFAKGGKTANADWSSTSKKKAH